MQDRDKRVNHFVSALYRLQRTLENAVPGESRAQASRARAALAQLRRGTGKVPGAAVEALPHVVPYLPDDASDWERQVFFLVGSLFAHHPTAYEARENLGDALRLAGSHESAEKRFAALLNCRSERLGYHLRQALRLAESKKIPINYRRLLFDLLAWNGPEHYVQLNWARAYWRPGETAQAADAASSEGENTP
jgi:CRISPR type I-E-associated protein CasB/Cse2